MKKLRIGVICPSDIAARRFLPAVKTIDDIEFCGVGVHSVDERFGDSHPSNEVVNSIIKIEMQKAWKIIDEYGGPLYYSYSNIVQSPSIDALYVPLPPALHYKWAKAAISAGKHVLIEKPATTSLQATKELVEFARNKGIALHENYMFVFHDQLKAVDEIVHSGEIGDVRLYRITFGFPRRAINDFRYVHSLGGGALLDAGGYTIKYASFLLGNTAKVVYAKCNYLPAFEVDMYGSGAMINDDGVTAQIAFGMDNDYKCELEAWGSKGTLFTGRILTAPAGLIPKAMIYKNGKVGEIKLPADDAFRKSIIYFYKCIEDSKTREENYKVLIRQADLVEDFARLAGIHEERE